MKLFISNLFKLKAIFLLTIAGTSSVYAGVPGGTITFGTGATAVPTLSGFMLLVLSLLLFVVAFKVAKQKNSNASKFFVMLLGVSALGLGGGGFKMVNNVEAGITMPVIGEPVGPGIEPTDIVFAPGTTVTTVQLESSVAFHFQNNLTPAQVINVTSAGPLEGFVCDYYESIEPEGVLDCLTRPSLSTGEICGIGCRPIDDGLGLGDIVDEQVLGKSKVNSPWK